MKYLAIAFILLIVGCGGGGTDPRGEGYVAIHLENSRHPENVAALTMTSQMSSRVHVTHFKVTITGEGISTPLVSEVDESATQISVLGIPAGQGRVILIEATNADGTVIRRRRLENIQIEAGVVTPIRTALNTVPVILNLQNGSIVRRSSLKVVGFGEPGGSLNVVGSQQIAGISASESPLGSVSPETNSGLFEFRPSTEVGNHSLTIRDSQTGESASINITVINDTLPGFRLNAAGSLQHRVSVGGLGGNRAVNFSKIISRGGNQ